MQVRYQAAPHTEAKDYSHRVVTQPVETRRVEAQPLGESLSGFRE